MARNTMHGRPLRVGLLAPPALPVPPVGYGGVEAVVHVLRRGLEARGVEVILAASGTPAGGFDQPVGLDLPAVEALAADLLHAAFAISRLGDMDVIHDHTKAAGAALASFSRVRVVTTVHNDMTPGRRMVYGACESHPFVFLSSAQAARYDGIKDFFIVPNGIDLDDAPFQARKEDYLLFLGRFSRVKGPHEAIAAAREAGLPLVLAGCVDPADRTYFEQEIAPHVDGTAVKLVGEVSGTQKWTLLSRARALVAPLLWEEPFGLVFIEAMACGTPVLTYRRGAAPEIVADGETGFLLDDWIGLARACAKVGALDAQACRQRVAQRFSATAMAEGYLAVYRSLLGRSAHEGQVRLSAR